MGITDSSTEHNNVEGKYNVNTFHYEIDKFYTSELTKQQFVHQLFSIIDQKPHPFVGNLTVCNTYIL